PTDEKKKRKYKDFGHEEEKATHAKVDMAQIELKAEDLYDKDKSKGRLELFGPNRLESKEENPFLQFLGFMWNTLSWVMEGAALVAIVLSNGGGCTPDWPDFVGIVLLLLMNLAIGFYEERNTGNTIKALKDLLAPKAKVRHDGKWSEIESANLVPSDMVAFKIGDVFPADCRLTEAINISIDQAALTGEALPQSKKNGDQGSTCKQVEAEGVIISTSGNTFFSSTASLVGQDNDTTGHLQKLFAQIRSFCLVSISLFILLEIVILYLCFHYSYHCGLNIILMLLIGGIPIAMPTVFFPKAIVTHITAIEESAGVTPLFSDKTGTLTTSKLSINQELVKTYGPFSPQDIILLTTCASCTKNQDTIDQCVGTLDDPTHACDVTKFTSRGLHALAVAYEELDHDNHEGEGNGFEVISLLTIFDPPRDDTKQTIDDAIALGDDHGC
ncbi:plasma membrane H+-ATPase, partial [Ceratobasidium sp. 423]